MNDETKIKKALEWVRRRRKQRFDFRVKQQVAEHGDYQKRQRRTMQTQNRLLSRGLQKVGIDSTTLDRLHEKDNKAAATFRARQMVKVGRHAVRLAQQRRKRSRRTHAFLKRHFGNRGGNPSVSIPMKIATDIDATPIWVGNGALSDVDFTQMEWNNSVRTTLSAGSSSDSGFVSVMLSYDFVWMADRTGIAEAIAWYVLDGTYSLWAEGKCTGERQARVVVEASVEATQPTPAEGTGTFTETTSIVDETVIAECTSRSHSSIIDDDDFRTVNKTGIPIVADHPVILSARLSIGCTASEDARAVLDAATDSVFGLCIPTAVLVVEY